LMALLISAILLLAASSWDWRFLMSCWATSMFRVF